MDSGRRRPSAAVLGIEERRREASATASRRPGMTTELISRISYDCLRRAMRLLLQAKRSDLLRRTISARELVSISKNTSVQRGAVQWVKGQPRGKSFNLLSKQDAGERVQCNRNGREMARNKQDQAGTLFLPAWALTAGPA